MIVFITGQAHNRKSGAPSGPARTERIDTNEEPLFLGCVTADDARRVFLEFWNDLNPESEDVVKVLGVRADK